MLSFARGQIELRHHRYDAAIERFDEALAIAERQTGSESLTVAGNLNALATAWLADRDWERAEQTFRRVLELRIRHLGEEHPATAQAANNLGLALKNLGRYDEAAEQLEQSLRRQQASLGPEHPGTEMVRKNLATVYYLQRRYPEAVALFDQDYADLDAAGIPDEYVLRRVHYYGISLSRAGDRRRARAMLELLAERCVALDQPSTGRSVAAELARLDMEEGHPRRALEALEALDYDGSNRPFQAQVAQTRAQALIMLGDREGARALLPQIEVVVDEAGAPSAAELADLRQQLTDAPAP